MATYHVGDSHCFDATAGTIRHKPAGAHEEITTRGWLRAGPIVVGVTAGASTPNNKVGEVIARIFETRGIEVGAALAG